MLWVDIYGHRNVGQPALPKDPKFYISLGEHTDDLANVTSEAHTRQRRIFASAFSDRALKLHEPLILKYLDKLSGKMRSEVDKVPTTKVDMVNM